jgi:hypothetical protein
MLRRIFEPKGEKVTEIWGKLHNKDLIIYTSHLIIAGYLTTLSATLQRAFHYYMPYFTVWSLDIKVSAKFMRTCTPWVLLKNYSYFNYNFHIHI